MGGAVGQDPDDSPTKPAFSVLCRTWNLEPKVSDKHHICPGVFFYTLFLWALVFSFVILFGTGLTCF